MDLVQILYDRYIGQSLIQHYHHLCLWPSGHGHGQNFNVSFTVKFPRAHIFQTILMDLVYNLFDRCQSKVLFSHTLTHTYDLMVKVMTVYVKVLH